MEHEQKIERIVDQVRRAAASGRPIQYAKKSVSHFVPNPYDDGRAPMIDLGDLTEILEVEDSSCCAESGVTFSELARQTLSQKRIPQTVPELKTITLGGAVAGCSIESMSYELGGFFDSCHSLEVVTGCGDVITCSATERPDLFEMMHGAYGTLGIITKLNFSLLEAKPYVELTYRHFGTFQHFWDELKERCTKGDFDFIDAIIHDKDHFVVCLGNLVEQAPYTSAYDWLEVFYKSTREKEKDFLSTYDYFFRYDADCHWLTKTVPGLETKAGRFLLGNLVLGSTNLIKWSNRLKKVMQLKKRPDVVVDVFIPSRQFEAFYHWYETSYSFYPLWIVPYRMKSIYPWVNEDYAKEIEDTFMIDCAIYGRSNNDPLVDYSEVLERKVQELRGIKTLISRNHYTKEQFWQIYNEKRWRALKEEVDPNNLFGDLYEKFAPNNYRG